MKGKIMSIAVGLICIVLGITLYFALNVKANPCNHGTINNDISELIIASKSNLNRLKSLELELATLRKKYADEKALNKTRFQTLVNETGENRDIMQSIHPEEVRKWISRSQ